jgi:hypothetical protein
MFINALRIMQITLHALKDHAPATTSPQPIATISRSRHSRLGICGVEKGCDVM